MDYKTNDIIGKQIGGGSTITLMYLKYWDFYSNEWDFVKDENGNHVTCKSQAEVNEYIKEHNPKQWERMTNKTWKLENCASFNGYYVHGKGDHAEYEEIRT